MATGGIVSSQVRYAPTGAVYFAAIGSAAPTDATTALTSAWTNVGYIDEDGVSVTPSVDLGDIRAWQTASRVKRTVNSVDIDVSFKMRQINKYVVAQFFFGGTTVQGAAGISTMTLPSNFTVSSLSFALCVDWTDDEGSANRLYFSRGVVGEREALQLVRTDAMKLGVTYSVTDANGEFGKLFSNNLDLYS